MAKIVSVNFGSPIRSINVVGPEGPVRPEKSAEQQKIESLQVELDALHVNIKTLQEEKQHILRAAQTLGEAARGLNEAREQLVEEMQAKLPDLCIAIAERILRHEIAQGHYDIKAIVTAALKEAPSCAQPVVKLNPKDLEMLGKHLDKTAGPELGHVKLEADSGMDPANCRVVTDKGFVDAAVSKQLEKIALALKGQEA